MKHALTAGLAGFALATTLAAGSARAGTYAFVNGNNSGAVFLAEDTIRPVPADGSNVVTYWVAIALLRDGTLGTNPKTAYTMHREEMDCDGQRERLLGIAEYSATDALVTSAESAGPWGSIVPDTIGDDVRKAVCDAQARAALTHVSLTPLELTQNLRELARKNPAAFGLSLDPQKPPASPKRH